MPPRKPKMPAPKPGKAAPAKPGAAKPAFGSPAWRKMYGQGKKGGTSGC